MDGGEGEEMGLDGDEEGGPSIEIAVGAGPASGRVGNCRDRGSAYQLEMSRDVERGSGKRNCRASSRQGSTIRGN